VSCTGVDPDDPAERRTTSQQDSHHRFLSFSIIIIITRASFHGQWRSWPEILAGAGFASTLNGANAIEQCLHRIHLV
jgi:hypothetical protein